MAKTKVQHLLGCPVPGGHFRPAFGHEGQRLVARRGENENSRQW
jgi:hypothetical protein